jgi:type II secretory pathway pseudopilin PulG
MVRFEQPQQQQQPEALIGPAQRNRRATMAEMLRSSAPQVLTSNGQGAAVLAMGAAGGLIDGITARQEATAAQQRAQAMAQALTGAVSGSLPQGMTPAQFQGLALANPDIAAKIAQGVLEQRMKPQERYEMTRLPDGRMAQRSALTGKLDVLPEGAGPMTASPGQVLFGRDGRQIAAVPERPPAPVSVPDGGRLVNPQTGQPIYQAPPGAPKVEKFQQPDGSQAGVQWDPNKGEFVPLRVPEGGTLVGPKPTNPFALPGKPTEEQGKAAGFASRMVQGHAVMNNLDAAAIDGWEALKARTPVGSNFIISEQKQKLEQSQRNFVNSILRRESGAVISPEEFQSAALQYFPQPGDSPAVIAQKRANREVAIEGVMGSAGPGYKVPEEYRPMRQQQQEGPPSSQGVPPPQQQGMQPQAQPGPAPEQVSPNLPALDAIEAEILRRQQQMQQAQPQSQMIPSMLPPMP